MPEVQYARAGDVHVAFEVTGEPGGRDVVVVAGALFPFEMLSEDRVASRFISGLAALGRVTLFDKRGVGLSDPVTDWSRSLHEQWADDLLAVVDAAGLEDPIVVSWERTGVARLAAKLRPGLFSAVVLINPSQSTEQFRALMRRGDDGTTAGAPIEELAFPSRINDPEFVAWLNRSGRMGASPAAAGRMWQHLLSFEGSLTPDGVDERVLVLHSRDCLVASEEVRDVVAALPNATLLEIDGVDTYPVAGDVGPLIAEISQFVTGGRSVLAPERAVAAVLFTDLVDSTVRAANEGDAQWRELLDVHDREVERLVLHCGGRVVKYTGDGILALVDSVTGAIDGARSIVGRMLERGLQVRAGIHVGDVDVRGDDVSGITVNIAARIMGQAGPGEILVSDAARIATLGSGYAFEPVGMTHLRGFTDDWALFRVVA